MKEELGQTGNKFNAIIDLYSSEGGVRTNGGTSSTLSLTYTAVKEELGQTGNKFNAIIDLYSSEGGVRTNGEQVQRYH